MQYSVGDKVVHPHHGPGQIAGVERRELLDGTKRYYVIEIPRQGLTVYMPVGTSDKTGMRLAMSRARLPRVLARLGSQPRHLPHDFKQRQEEVWERLRTGRVRQLAGVVRDLTWHRERAHLTRKDSEYLKLGHDLLAGEMALVSGDTVSDASNLIDDTMSAAMTSQLK
ncbi:CarD family transcriptional regulator [Chloroflexota bacterium]